MDIHKLVRLQIIALLSRTYSPNKSNTHTYSYNILKCVDSYDVCIECEIMCVCCAYLSNQNWPRRQPCARNRQSVGGRRRKGAVLCIIFFQYQFICAELFFLHAPLPWNLCALTMAVISRQISTSTSINAITTMVITSKSAATTTIIR